MLIRNTYVTGLAKGTSANKSVQFLNFNLLYLQMYADYLNDLVIYTLIMKYIKFIELKQRLRKVLFTKHV